MPKKWFVIILLQRVLRCIYAGGLGLCYLCSPDSGIFQVLDCNLTALLTLGLALIYSKGIKMPADGTQEYGASFPGCVSPVKRGGVYHKWLPLCCSLYRLFFSAFFWHGSLCTEQRQNKHVKQQALLGGLCALLISILFSSLWV